MKLYWVQYKKPGSRSRNMLLLVLGTQNGKLYCLDADGLSSEDKGFLAARAKYLDKLALNDKLAMLKDIRPGVFTHFKTIYLSNITVQNEYSLGSKKPSKK